MRALDDAIRKQVGEIVAHHEEIKPNKPLPIAVPDEPWPHGCAIEPCPTCEWHAWLKSVAGAAVGR